MQEQTNEYHSHIRMASIVANQKYIHDKKERNLTTSLST